MLLFKKLFFALPFLIFFFVLLISFRPLIHNFYQIFFSFDPTALFIFIGIALLTILSSFFYVIFVVLSQKWEYVIPVIVIASLIPIFLVPINLGIIFMIGFLIIHSVAYAQIFFKLKKYVNFDPDLFFTPIIKKLNFFVILVITLTLFFYLNTEIKTNGFKLPDSVLDLAIKMSMSGVNQEASVLSVPSSTTNQIINQAQSFGITKEQISLLKNNPKILEQYGIDPKILDDPSLSSSITDGELESTGIEEANLNSNLMKVVLKDQFQKMIEPYLSFIPLFLAMLFFFSLSFFLSIFSIFISPSLILMFRLLRQSGFVKFEKVMVEVEKLIV